MNDAMIEWIDTVHVEWRLIYFLSFLTTWSCLLQKKRFPTHNVLHTLTEKAFHISCFEFRASQFL